MYDYYVVYFIGSIIMCVIFGFVTKHINESKGYQGGFLWGFFLGIIGVIVVACKTPYSPPYDESQSIIAAKIREQDIIRDGGWYCARCNTLNTSIVSNCVCGTSKEESERIRRQRSQPQVVDKEMENINKLKSYKELLDSGVITQEEFDKKKSDLLKM